MTQKENQEPPNGRLIGYARVSTDDQSLNSQIQALKEHGVDARLIFKDKASGVRMERSGLEACLTALREGDLLIVWRLDRLGRSLKHLIEIVEQLQARGAGLRSLQDGVIDTTTASRQLIFAMFSALAQFERNLISERTRAGLAGDRRFCGAAVVPIPRRTRNAGTPEGIPAFFGHDPSLSIRAGSHLREIIRHTFAIESRSQIDFLDHPLLPLDHSPKTLPEDASNGADREPQTRQPTHESRWTPEDPSVPA